jgi:oligopeptide/dipeptide ABC transporter ATP-binding protein
VTDPIAAPKIAEAGLQARPSTPLLRIRGLRTHFFTEAGVAKAVDGLDLDIMPGEVLGLVGESGSGKSVTALSILRLVPDPPGRIVGGEIWFGGRDLLALPWEEIRKIRGREISMIFQEPMTSLNPVFTIGNQISEAIILHQGLGKRDALAKSIEMLQKVGIATPERRVHEYPHQLSGGMRQRAMIAMALSCNPKILLADEPTTALDVTIQAQILDLMFNLKEQLGMAIILITHNLGVVAESARRVVVMYCGKVVEEGPVLEIFKAPQHPYTQGLLQSLPRLEEKATGQKQRLMEIPGIVPSAYNLPTGCKFHPRCPKAQKICQEQEPPLEKVPGGHESACFFPG